MTISSLKNRASRKQQYTAAALMTLLGWASTTATAQQALAPVDTVLQIRQAAYQQDGAQLPAAIPPGTLPSAPLPPAAFAPATGAPSPMLQQVPFLPTPMPMANPAVPMVPSGQGAQPLPPPAAGPQRLELLPPLPPGMANPVPTAEVSQRFDRFIQRKIDPENTLEVILGRPRILVFNETPKRIYLPDESIAAFQVIDDRQISIVGRSVGSTALNLWVIDPETGKEIVLSYLVKVLPEPQLKERLEAVYAGLEREINQAFPRSKIQLSLIGDQLAVRGQAHDAVEANQILQIVARHSPTKSQDEFGRPVQYVQQAAFIDQQRDPLVDQDQAFLRQTVVDSALLARSGIINLLQIPGEQQVMLRVTVAEVNRTAARSIGLNFSVQNNQGTTVFQNLTGQLGAAGGGNLSNVLASLDNGQVILAINALRSLRLAKTLAEPNLTTLNGQQATFRAGGSFPVPQIGGLGGTGLQGTVFVPFGVSIEFTPYVIDRDRIRLKLSAGVSVRDESLGTSIGGSAGAGGTQVAGLNSRTFDSTVELREGQTLAVAGLIQTNMGADSDRVPFWGDLPIIGHTGGFSRTTAGEQELVILVTPELVHPLEACDTPSLPGADVFETGDIEFYLGNHLEARRMRDYRSTVRTDFARIRAGDKLCEDQFIIGPNGPTYGCCDKNSGGCLPASVVPPVIK
ncbi:type II and III secretion system protein [Pirellula staleyi DSM 6068]|uniref:Type II and III secretion system protein n=1 Tax=Pirellula staleyi (strain ATCC 27377 / DSM 6068 / ICPB 4128) TaxID=530564 RepID=D2R937_PIRSD|nr:pilus assembly protein N-terminal domain-containing protein [Pirellula staleyi]ADB15864.1 type II and III secretion system protein [Pirellula staleyi DSM 6068]